MTTRHASRGLPISGTKGLLTIAKFLPLRRLHGHQQTLRTTDAARTTWPRPIRLCFPLNGATRPAQSKSNHQTSNTPPNPTQPSYIGWCLRRQGDFASLQVNGDSDGIPRIIFSISHTLSSKVDKRSPAFNHREIPRSLRRLHGHRQTLRSTNAARTTWPRPIGLHLLPNGATRPAQSKSNHHTSNTPPNAAQPSYIGWCLHRQGDFASLQVNGDGDGIPRIIFSISHILSSKVDKRSPAFKR